MRRISTLFILLTTLAVTGLAACDDGETPSTAPADTSDGTENCQTYVQGISAATPEGTYTVAISEATPAPPDKGLNTLMLTVTDAGGNPVDGGITLVVEPWMPAHGHGSTNVTATARGSNGEWDAPDVNLIMPGAWEFRMLITEDADTATEHKAVFTFCAEG